MLSLLLFDSLGCFRIEGVTEGNFLEAGSVDVASFISAKSPLAGGHFARLIRACAASLASCLDVTVAFQRQIQAHIACIVHVIMPDLGAMIV